MCHEGQLQFHLKMIITILNSAFHTDNSYTGRLFSVCRRAIKFAPIAKQQLFKIKLLSALKQLKNQSVQFRALREGRREILF